LIQGVIFNDGNIVVIICVKKDWIFAISGFIILIFKFPIVSCMVEFSGRLFWLLWLDAALVRSFEAYVFVLAEERGGGTLSG
jgi:hypothetical protein